VAFGRALVILSVENTIAFHKMLDYLRLFQILSFGNFRRGCVLVHLLPYGRTGAHLGPPLAHLWPDYHHHRIINLVRRAACLYFVGLCAGLGYFVAHVVAHHV